MQMTLTGTTLVTYLPNLNGNPMGASLLGYPIVVSDFLNTLGDEGDFALVNPDFYALGLRQALTVESSIHYAFVDDVTTYRFVARAGGIPIPDGTYAYRSVSSSKVDEHSPFVVLDDVVAS
jgi:HK97 family phage major capsid protein